MRRGFPALVGLMASALLVLLAPAEAGQTATLGGRTVTVKTDVSIEKVAADSAFPFDKPEPGEFVFFRIKVSSEGPAIAKRGELWVLADVFSVEKPSVRGRQGVQCEVGRAAAAWQVRCRNSRVFRDNDSVSVLVRVEAGGRRVTLQAGALKARELDSDFVVKSNTDRAAITVVAEPPPAAPSWSGTWSWTAKNVDTGAVFFAAPTPMTIVQEGNTVCALWAFSGGGIAKGTVSGRTWTARWDDGFGSGTWTLTLAAGGASFDGDQTITPDSGATAFAAKIEGKRQGAAPATLRCSEIDL